VLRYVTINILSCPGQLGSAFCLWMNTMIVSTVCKETELTIALLWVFLFTVLMGHTGLMSSTLSVLNLLHCHSLNFGLRHQVLWYSFRDVFCLRPTCGCMLCAECELTRSSSSSWMNRRQTDTVSSAVLWSTSATVRHIMTGCTTEN